MMPGNYKVQERSRVVEHITEAINHLQQALKSFADLQEEDRIVTCTQAAEQLGCTVQTISKYIRQGKLTKSHDGMMCGIWQTELNTFLVARKMVYKKKHKQPKADNKTLERRKYARVYYQKNKERLKAKQEERIKKKAEELIKAKEDNAIIA